MKSWRFNFIFLFIILIAAAIGNRLFSLQVKNYELYAALSQGQFNSSQSISPLRGEIFFQEKSQISQPLALNKEGKIVYAVPRKIENPEKTSEILSSILEIPKEALLKKITNLSDPYQPLKNEVLIETAKEIEKLNLEGIGFKPEYFRYYPQDNLGSSVVGFVGYNQDKKTGQAGLERFYNKELEGETDLILTIDYNLQYISEKKLREVVEKWGAQRGTIVISDPVTGKILAMADFPSFNPNQYSEVEDQNIFINKAVQSLFEPGSVFKPITMAAAIDNGKITPSTTYIDEGYVKVGGRILRNVDGRTYGQQTMTQVLEKSLNTGAIFVVEKLAKSTFRDYLRAFGFSEKTEIDLPGEIKGDINNLNTLRDINYATASYGQGITMTPIQLVTAFSAIANQGKMMRPYLVDKKNLDTSQLSAKEIKTEPETIREVISHSTASKLTAMMVQVVEEGYGKPAKVPGYYIAGKTGTAQIPYTSLGEDRPGYSDQVWHSFLGFAPALNPRFLIFIKLDSPYGIRFAADSVGPVFKEIAEYIFNYWEIPPDY